MYALAENDGAFDKLTRDAEAKRGEAMPPEIKEIIRGIMKDPSGLQINIHKDQTFAAFSPAIKVAEIFLNMKWSLAAAKGGFFLTSDNPVVKYVDPASVHPIYGDHGLMNKTIMVFIALSPAVLLVLSHEEHPVPQYTTLDRTVVDDWSKLRAYFAEQYVYASVNRPELLELVTKLKGSRPALTGVGYGPAKFGRVVVQRRWRDK
jgi:hypothetical protein